MHVFLEGLPSNREFVGQRVLIVDDFQGMRTMLREMFASFGVAAVEAAAQAEQALSLLSHQHYDIVLCDYNLGDGKNGQNLLEEAKHRKLVDTAQIWVMITGEKTLEMVASAVDYQPDEYLLKPVYEGLLRSRIERLIKRRKAFADINRAAESKNYGEGVALCDRLLAEGRHQQELCRLKARLLMLDQRWEEAAACFSEALAARSLPWAKCGLAQIAFQQGRLESARDLYQEAMQEFPACLEAFDGLAGALAGLGDQAGAKLVLERAAAMSPNSYLRQTALADTARRLGDARTAERAYRRAVQLGQYSIFRTPEPYFALADIHAAANRPTDALKVLADVRRLFSDDRRSVLQALLKECELHRAARRDELIRLRLAQAQELIGAAGTAADTEAVLQVAALLLEIGASPSAVDLLKSAAARHDGDEQTLARIAELFNRAGVGGTAQA